MKTIQEVRVKNVTIGTGSPKICVPIVADTKEGILNEAQEIEKSVADLVEWRADLWEEELTYENVLGMIEKLQKILKTKPLLFTIRTREEGGEFTGSLQQYQQAVLAAAKLSDLVDVEVFMKELDTLEFIERIHKESGKVVGSNHDFCSTPEKEEIVKRLKCMDEYGADILKIAVMPQDGKDVLTLLDATQQMRTHTNKPVVTMSMGQLGKLSRISGQTFSSAITFGSLMKASAPGQIKLEELKKILEILG